MISSVVAAAALIATYNCEVGAPQFFHVEGDHLRSVPTQLPPETQQRKFSISISDGDPMQADVKWPGDPMQIAGQFPVLSTGPAAYAFSAHSFGPCLFTESACITQIDLVDANETAANVIIAPAGISLNTDTKIRSPNLVVMTGTCSRVGTK